MRSFTRRAGEYDRPYLEQLFQISETFALHDAWGAIPEVLERAAEARSLRTAVLVLRRGRGLAKFVWPMSGEEFRNTAHVERHAEAAYDYLIGTPVNSADSARQAIDEIPVRERTVVLPLAVEHRPPLGVFLLEFDADLEPIDVTFASAITYQVALALDRQDLKDEEARLRAKAEALAAENGRLLEEARRSVQARDEILAIASHDLRGPLNVFCIRAQMLLAHASASQLEPGTISALEVLTRQTRRLGVSIANLVDVASLHARGLELELDDVDLVEVVQGVVALVAEDPESKGGPVRVEAEGPVLGRWDALRLEQLVRNLVVNAIKYGLGRPVEVRIGADAGSATLSVIDQGSGIAEADLNRIFEKFERADSAQGVSGLGLGLYIVRRIVEAHGGTIRARSEVGSGTTFTVTLPRGIQGQD